MRHVAIAWIASVSASGVACNSLLGNSDHEVAADASISADAADGGAIPIDGSVPDGTADSPADSGSGGGDAEGGVIPPSCAPGGAGMTNCGGGSASCCTSPEIPAGTYYRSFDGFTYTSMADPATVSAFRLDQYEVTVGRFRQFVGAVAGGWLPTGGSGKHTHLNGGRGVYATGGGYEHTR